MSATTGDTGRLRLRLPTSLLSTRAFRTFRSICSTDRSGFKGEAQSVAQETDALTQAHAVKLNVAAELLGKLAGLLQSGRREDWSADALLLPRAIRQGQGAPEAQPFAGWGETSMATAQPRSS